MSSFDTALLSCPWGWQSTLSTCCLILHQMQSSVSLPMVQHFIQHMLSDISNNLFPMALTFVVLWWIVGSSSSPQLDYLHFKCKNIYLLCNMIYLPICCFLISVVSLMFARAFFFFRNSDSETSPQRLFFFHKQHEKYTQCQVSCLERMRNTKRLSCIRGLDNDKKIFGENRRYVVLWYVIDNRSKQKRVSCPTSNVMERHCITRHH